MTGKNKRKRKNIFKGSKILDFLFFIADWLYRKIGVSVAAFIFTGYETCERYYEKSFFYRLFQGYESGPVKNFVRKIKKAIIIKCENGIVINGIKKFADNILSAGLNTIGVFFLSVGFYSTIIYLLKIFILGKPETMRIDLIAGCVLIVFSVLLIVFGRQSLYESLRGSVICSAVLFGFLGLPERTEKQSKNTNYNLKKVNIICFFIGMVFGLTTYFTTLPGLPDLGAVMPMCCAIAGVAVFYVILCYPEAGFLAFLFAVPFLPPGNLVLTGAAPCILISGCYFLKLIRGKRTFTFEIFDLFVLMFSILIFFSGVVSVSKTGSIKPAMVYMCFTLIYFTGVNIIRSKEMIKRSVSIIMFSGFLVAAYGVYQNYFGMGDQTWQDSDMFSEISGRVVSTLENPNVLAEYLILIIPFVIVSVFIAGHITKRMRFIIYALFTIICLVFTWSRGSWLGFIFSCLILFVIINRKSVAAYLGVAVLIPFVPVALPMVAQRFTSIGNIMDSSTSYRVSIWQAALDMIRDYIMQGIGVGREPFKLVYPAYALAGIESAPHSHSLYLQVCVESGMIGLIVLVFILFFFMQYCFTAIKKANEKYIKLFAAAGLCAVLGFMLNGFTDYVWYNYRVYLMFWLVVSITVAVCRFGLKNQAQNDGINIA